MADRACLHCSCKVNHKGITPIYSSSVDYKMFTAVHPVICVNLCRHSNSHVIHVLLFTIFPQDEPKCKVLWERNTFSNNL
jgi:hypothetical protein